MSCTAWKGKKKQLKLICKMSERCCDFRWKDRNNAAVNCMLQFLGTCSDGLLMCRMSLIKPYILQGLNWRLSSSPCMTNTMLSLTEARQITLEAQTVSGKRWDCGFTQTGLSQLDAFVSFSLENQKSPKWLSTGEGDVTLALPRRFL